MRFARRQVGFLAIALLFYLALDLAAPTPAQQNPPSTDGQDAAAKAAERKKRFEEQKRRLEEAAEGGSHGGVESGHTLFISPAVVNMVVGDYQSFSAFDLDGRTVTHGAPWSLSNSYVAELSTQGDPTITSKDHGTVTVRARIDARTAEAKVTVISGNTLPLGSVRWSSGDIPGYKTTKIMPAVPSPSGVDVFECVENAEGETILRALLSDGRQLWKRRFGRGAPTGSIPGFRASPNPY